ncbi:MAG TPA: hypothetical protein VLC07_09135 [Solirubrobacterales bacterium]|nr:hypothetical protein [Solirubrobacterales bacterium]
MPELDLTLVLAHGLFGDLERPSTSQPFAVPHPHSYRGDDEDAADRQDSCCGYQQQPSSPQDRPVVEDVVDEVGITVATAPKLAPSASELQQRLREV